MVLMEALLLSLLLSMISVDAISPGSTLYASDTSQTWSSPNNKFSLQFLPTQTTTSPSPSPSFMVGIVYSGGAPIIWTAGAGAFVDSGGSFRLLSSGTLQLVNGYGINVWDSRTSHLAVSSAFLDDQGNLVLSNGSHTVWSSFNYPTDTLVPSQNFTSDMVLQSGLYSFKFLSSGNLMLRWNENIVYWNKGLNASLNGTLTSPVLGLQPMGILSIHDPNLTSTATAIVAYSSDYAERRVVLRILKLDGDGNLRIYSYFRGSGNATIRWTAVEDQCKVFAYCGAYGFCSYKNSIPVCRCPSQNFVMVDPNDGRKGCRRKAKLEDCAGRVGMLQLEHALLLTYPPVFYVNPEVLYIPVSACKGNCIGIDSCFASTSLSDGTGFCYLKTTDFFSGYSNPALTSTSYIKVCLPLAPNSQTLYGMGKNWRMNAWIVVAIVSCTLLALVAFQGGLWFWCCRNSPRFGGLYGQYALMEYASGAPVRFSYKELKGLTNRFKEKLGAGRFASVHRGMLVNGTIVAVKQLEGIEPEEKQFKIEIATLCSTHHINLVRLIGFCSEEKHRLLVYEFMENGSLDKFLFRTEENSGTLLDWETRFNIALGSAKGIMYIHEECRNCIVHCNIKPENILLDENFNAKISDAGLVKLINPEDQRNKILLNMRGTKGYVAPEWLSNLEVTSKSDVYSYGMVLLEIVSGKRNFEVSEGTNDKEFSAWAYEEFERGNLMGIVDKRLALNAVDFEQVKRLVHASFWCIQEQPSMRPTMGKVLQMLEGVSNPKKPPKSMRKGSFSRSEEWLRSNDVSAVSTVPTSAPNYSSSSSSHFQIIGLSPFARGDNKGESPLLSET